jgi:hypothetical protein
MNLGRHVAGTLVFYGQNFHNDQGSVEDPTTPTARMRTPAGVWGDLAAPTKQDGQTGHYGGTIDTTGYAEGQYAIRMTGTVATGKVVATELCFEVGPAPAVPGDAMTLTSAYDAAKTAAQAGDAMTLTGAERNAVADAHLDRADGIETAWTPRQAVRIILSGLAGKLSGAATTNVKVRDVGDTKNRIDATVDADGNRTAVTLDKT